jgi:hypothetical protein
MIGAQRPTVSLGLTRLAESELLRPQPGGWLISPASLEEFPMLRPLVSANVESTVST